MKSTQPGRNPGGECTHPECEDLHAARDKLGRERTLNYSACTASVERMAALKGVFEIAAPSTLPNSASSSGSAALAAEGPRRGAEHVKNVAEVRKACEKVTNLNQRQACYASVHAMADAAQDDVPASPIVRSIQKQVSKEIQKRNESSLDSLDAAADAIRSNDIPRKVNDKDDWSNSWSDE